MQEITSGFHKQTFMVNETLLTNCAQLGLMERPYQTGLWLERLSAVDPALTYPVRTKLCIAPYEQRTEIESHRTNIAQWCDDNLSGKWDFLSGPYIMAFETAEDAMFFRMVWE